MITGRKFSFNRHTGAPKPNSSSRARRFSNAEPGTTGMLCHLAPNWSPVSPPSWSCERSL